MPGTHSRIGFSGAKRYRECEASVRLSAGIVGEESEHAALGTAVHSLIEHCFKTNTNAWERVGKSVIEGTLVTREMANSAQVMLDAVREAHPDRNQGNSGYETHFHAPSIHPECSGTVDVWFLDEQVKTLHLWDYKNGAGVIVEVPHNDQEMGYACALLERLDLWEKLEDGQVTLHIIQPNAYHRDGPVREWTCSVSYLVAWLEDQMIPLLHRVTGDGPLEAKTGEHCRFCPAKDHACPALAADMDELEKLTMEYSKPDAAAVLAPEQIGRYLNLFETAKIVASAVNKVGFQLSMAGVKIPGWKLVTARANRKWKDGALAAAEFDIGDKAFEPRQFKSPAEIDKLPKGTTFTAQWAEKPDAGLTLVKEADARPEVSRDTKSMFQDVTKQKDA